MGGWGGNVGRGSLTKFTLLIMVSGGSMSGNFIKGVISVLNTVTIGSNRKIGSTIRFASAKGGSSATGKMSKVREEAFSVICSVYDYIQFDAASNIGSAWWYW